MLGGSTLIVVLLAVIQLWFAHREQVDASEALSRVNASVDVVDSSRVAAENALRRIVALEDSAAVLISALELRLADAEGRLGTVENKSGPTIEIEAVHSDYHDGEKYRVLVVMSTQSGVSIGEQIVLVGEILSDPAEAARFGVFRKWKKSQGGISGSSRAEDDGRKMTVSFNPLSASQVVLEVSIDRPLPFLLSGSHLPRTTLIPLVPPLEN